MLTPEEVKNLEKTLEELGLTELERRLYLLSLESGPSPLSELADKLKIPRPNVYRVISGLEKHGLAVFSERKKFARDFVVEPPTLVLELLRKKRQASADLEAQLVSAMPDYLTLYRQGAGSLKVRIYDGREQYGKLFNQMIEEEKGSIDFFGADADWMKEVSWDDEWRAIRRRVKKGVSLRLLMLPGAETEKLRAEKELQVRTLTAIPAFTAAFQLFSNKVVFWQPAGRLAVVIEDEAVTAMMRHIFDWAWDSSK